MKITKAKLNEAIRRILAGGNISPDLSVHKVDIDVLVTYIGLDLISQYIEEYRRREGDRAIPGHMLVSVTVDTTDSNGKYSVTLPLKVVELPNDEGVYRVSRAGHGEAMICVNSMYQSVFTGTIADAKSKMERYRVEGDTIYFENLSGKLPSVDMLLLGIPSDENTMLNVPAGYQDKLMDMVISRSAFMMSNPEDRVLNRRDDNGVGDN